jgi:hypothetical protein
LQLAETASPPMGSSGFAEPLLLAASGGVSDVLGQLDQLLDDLGGRDGVGMIAADSLSRRSEKRRASAAFDLLRDRIWPLNQLAEASSGSFFFSMPLI